jgi:ABC-2 type transport system ATP-binding protein
MVVTTGLTKRFGARTAVDSVELAVPAGSCFGFLGPNGAGKTTMIRLLLGLARPTAGRVLLGGVDVQHEPTRALARVGAIVEEPRFHAHLTGVENLRVHAPLIGADAVSRIPYVLDLVGLGERGDDKVKGYSMGMRQRLGVARAMLGDPELLVLDEPTNGLDAAGMADFRVFIRRLVEEEGRTVFLSSHLLDEMEKLCDAVAIVEEGRVVRQSSMTALLDEGGRALLVLCDDAARAITLLEGASGVTTATALADGAVRIEGDLSPAAVAALNRRLVEAGIGVHGLRLDAQTLERRFLELTGVPPAPRKAAP